MSTLVNEFLTYARSCGLSFANEIICDGLLHRIQVEGDKQGKKNGWYIYHDEIIPVCIFGTWKGEQKHVWSARHESELNKKERDQLKRMLAEASRKARRQRQLEQKSTAVDCGRIYSQAKPCYQHAYLDKKIIQTDDCLKIGDKGEMIIPVVDCHGVISSLQYIYPNGRKMFHPNGKVSGGFCPIVGKGEAIYICEGFATGKTINQSTGNSVYVAFNCGNLFDVARFVQSRYPHNMVVIAGDDDFMTKTPIDNPGRHHAEKVAISLGIHAIYPSFDAYHRKADHTDFNDMHYEGETNSINDYVKNHINDRLIDLIGGELT